MSVHSTFANCNDYVITNYIGSNIYTFVSALCLKFVSYNERSAIHELRLNNKMYSGN